MTKYKFSNLWIFAIVYLFIIACSDSNNKNIGETMNIIKTDKHSYSIAQQAVITHLDLNIKVNFDKKTIAGSAFYQIKKQEDAEVIHFDTWRLQIKNIYDQAGNELKFSLSEHNEVLGSDLSIALPKEIDQFIIEYETDPSALALQWLEAPQTKGGKHPFLFTQSQAILARTWIPLQDSPGIRFTYSAKVEVPKDLMALMSAANPTQKNESGIYEFKMNQAIPAYLMALCVGDIVFEKIGNRTGVYSEPEMLAAATKEFSEMEKMLLSAEKLYGPYAWDRYDLIVLPPSFPFGGMENPRITFCTPTVIAGDKSLIGLVAHELAHSWSGNLVTNETWNDFWLNEGFTVYFERRIMEEIYGKEYAEMLEVLGYQDLQATLDDIGRTSADTRLKLDLNGRNPNEGMTEVAYEKGNAFLKKIESVVGREKFDQFLKNYFNKHAFKTITTEKFLEELETQLLTKDQVTLVAADAWIYKENLPENHLKPQSSKLQIIENKINLFSSGKLIQKRETANWSTQEWLYYLRGIKTNLSLETARKLEKEFAFSASGNSEIAFEWMHTCITLNMPEIEAALNQFLEKIGRRKFIKPLYDAMLKSNYYKDKAVENFNRFKAGYHPVTIQSVEALINSK
jgi:aminopeptidase N